MDLDVVQLSRIQFALTIMFHYLFPPLTIGLSMGMVLMEAMFLKTKNPQYEAMARFWTKLFAVNFAMGVATGIVMEFQFGTNWAAYSRFVGDVFGAALAAEGIFAFFLESGFLAVLVFGWDRVSPKMHFFATLMVCIGGIFSSVWITVANSWQQTPAGFELVETAMGTQARLTDFWAAVFNPSSIDRLLHVWIGAFLLGDFFIMSISAWYLLHKRHEDFARKSFVVALMFSAVFALAQLLSGDSNSNMVARHQPAKLAAMEAHYQTGRGDLLLFGIPDDSTQSVRYGVAIPGGLSFLLHRNFSASVPGLDQIPPADRPPTLITFVCFRLMVALGMYFILVTLLALWFWKRGTLFQKRWLLWVFVVSVLGPYAANELGWMVAEIGRQPWTVYGLLRTSDSISPVIEASQVLSSILMFSLVYALLFLVWLYVMHSKIQHGPDEVAVPGQTTAKGLFDAASERVDHRRTMTQEDGEAGGQGGKDKADGATGTPAP